MALTLPKPVVRIAEIGSWLLLGGLLLYRFVLPHPSAPLGPQLAATRLAAQGKPLVIEFSSTR
ncbi:MAG TPA: hypothetical protein V6D47_01795 [Oscillatoriaceae cyanobacterium]